MQTVEFGYSNFSVVLNLCKSVYACSFFTIIGCLCYCFALLCLVNCLFAQDYVSTVCVFSDDALLADVTTFPTV